MSPVKLQKPTGLKERNSSSKSLCSGLEESDRLKMKSMNNQAKSQSRNITVPQSQNTNISL